MDDILKVPITDERPWVVFAACRDEDPALFFPQESSPTGEALTVCRGCPVQSECLDFALETRQMFGIWGGTTGKQRRRLLRRSA